MTKKSIAMANQNSRLPENVPGPYYVTNQCIDCGMCPEIAGAVFRRNANIGYSVVLRQPMNEQEIAQAEEAMTSCPADAIGNDGDA